jgi:hypothetical protein
MIVVWCVQEAELQARALSREEANRAAGGRVDAAEAERRRRQQYAQDLENQMRMKKVSQQKAGWLRNEVWKRLPFHRRVRLVFPLGGARRG